RRGRSIHCNQDSHRALLRIGRSRLLDTTRVGVLPQPMLLLAVELSRRSQAQSHFGRQREFSMAGMKTLNIEAGMPTVEEARQILLAELKQAKQRGVAAVKIIHGYGSTGKGG